MVHSLSGSDMTTPFADGCIDMCYDKQNVAKSPGRSQNLAFLEKRKVRVQKNPTSSKASAATVEQQMRTDRAQKWLRRREKAAYPVSIFKRDCPFSGPGDAAFQFPCCPTVETVGITLRSSDCLLRSNLSKFSSDLYPQTAFSW